MQFHGAVPPMVTPLAESGNDVDTETLRSFTRFLEDGGIHALFPCGSLGEFSSLSRSQRATVIETVVESADDTPVLAGCGGTSVDEVCDLLADAAAKGADAAVIVTPYYLEADDEGLIDFYERLIETTSIPIFLYDIPSITDNHLSVDAVAELATYDNVIGIKDSTGDITYHQELIERTPDSFDVFQGLAELSIPALDIGADGFVAGPANVYPGSLADIYEAYRHGKRDQAIELWREVSNPIVSATKSVQTAPGLKYLLRRRGQNVGGPLPPLSPLSGEEKEQLDVCYRNVEANSQNVHSFAD